MRHWLRWLFEILGFVSTIGKQCPWCGISDPVSKDIKPDWGERIPGKEHWCRRCGRSVFWS